MIVRPVRSSDLPALIDLARSTGTGLTTLPANEERLTHRVGWAEKTFRGEAGRGDADYLFVLENDEGHGIKQKNAQDTQIEPLSYRYLFHQASK